MKVIGVISGKGGVGKTTTVANLGVSLSKFKKKTLVVDGNFSTPDLGLRLGMYSFHYNLQDVLNSAISIDKAIYNHLSGVDILPSSLSYNNIGVDIRDLKGYMQDLKSYDFILIDSPPGLGDEIYPILDISDELLIVTNPEIPAITDGLRAVEISKRMTTPIRGVVLNRVRGEKYELSILEVESVFDVPVLATIPEDAKVRECIAIGNPITLNYPYSSVAVGFRKFGALLTGEEYSLGIIERIKCWIKNLMGKGVEGDVLEKKTLKRQITTKEAIDMGGEETVPEVEDEKPVIKESQTPDKERILSLKSTMNRLNMRRDIVESILNKLEKGYEEGSINKTMYNRMKRRYRSEVKGYSKEIKKIESELLSYLPSS